MRIKIDKLVVKTLTILALIFGVIFTTPSYALGKLGHQLVCQLAFDHLSKNNQKKVTNLLLNMPNQHRQITNKYNYKKKNSAITFAQTCSWADAIKKHPKYKQFKALHYLNVSRYTLQIDHDACRINCLIKAIPYHQQQFESADNPWKKLQGLMFLSHWLGDIHQPLHVSFSSDRGGNKNKISSKYKKCNNLHWLWDECLLYPEDNTIKKKQVFNLLYKKLTQQWQSSDIATWQSSSVEQWATESLSITRSPEFLYCKLDSKKRCVSLSNNIIMLPNDYYSKHATILEQRILKSAVRLNYLIEESLL